MSLVINTNVSSLLTQNNLGKSQSALAAATQRLSSGLRINGAADNAAGFAISQRYTTQIGGLAQASANASDAINLAQTTSSSLDEVTANLQAVRDLAAQSANGTYTDADRATIDNEVQQRLAEVTRIANQTTFNGKKVLDGSLQSQSFQIGANVGQTVSVSLGQSVKTSDLGQLAEVKSGDISAAFSSSDGLILKTGDLVVNGRDVTGQFSDVDSLAAAINAQIYYVTGSFGGASSTGTEVHVYNSAAAQIEFSGLAGAALGLTGNVTSGQTLDTSGASTAVAVVNPPPDLSSEGLSINGTAVDLSSAKSLQDVSDVINAKGLEGVSAAVSGDGNGINFYSTGTLTIDDTGGNIIDAAKATDGNGGGAHAAGDVAAAGGSLATGSVGTVDKANELISRIDVALGAVAGFAARLGAVQNRFQSTLATLTSQSTNLKASQSTIQDADFAAETASLSKAQVLQQAGISVLSQANSNPQQVLKLLQ